MLRAIGLLCVSGISFPIMLPATHHPRRRQLISVEHAAPRRAADLLAAGHGLRAAILLSRGDGFIAFLGAS